MSLVLFGMALPWLIVVLFVALGACIGFQLIHQNGRLLSRLEALENRLGTPPPAPPLPGEGSPMPRMAPAYPPPFGPAPQPPAAPAPPQGLPLGSRAPEFALPDLEGARRSLAEFRGRRLLLVFFNPSCGFCTQMAPDLAVLAGEVLRAEALGMGEAGPNAKRQTPNALPLPLVVSTGEAEENRKLVAEHGIRCPVLLQESMEIAAQYQCHGTPMGYLIDEEGKIASEQAVGAQALLALGGDPPATRVPGRQTPGARGNGAGPLGGQRPLEESKLERNGLPAGTPAPLFRLPLLYGGELALEEYRGRKVLLVFSSPSCGPCDQLMPLLEQAYRRCGAVQVLMVSRDAAELNQAKLEQHGVTFPVVLQRQWEISREYAMFATPIAYLIDEQGVIAAEVATGVEPVLALLATGAEARCRCGRMRGECGCGKQREKAAAARQEGR